MTIQHLTPADAIALDNPGVRSEQLLWPHNAPEAHSTMTRMTMRPGATTARHAHPGSEQVCLVQHRHSPPRVPATQAIDAVGCL